MRLGVLDVGSNTVHFLVVDAHQGGRPLPVFSHKAELQLGNSLEDGKLSRSCALRLRAFVPVDQPKAILHIFSGT